VWTLSRPGPWDGGSRRTRATGSPGGDLAREWSPDLSGHGALGDRERFVGLGVGIVGRIDVGSDTSALPRAAATQVATVGSED
jgi:hypothetical protein